MNVNTNLFPFSRIFSSTVIIFQRYLKKKTPLVTVLADIYRVQSQLRKNEFSERVNTHPVRNNRVYSEIYFIHNIIIIMAQSLPGNRFFFYFTSQRLCINNVVGGMILCRRYDIIALYAEDYLDSVARKGRDKTVTADNRIIRIIEYYYYYIIIN